MNKDTMQKIAEEAFIDELEKISGKKSEVAGTAIGVGGSIGGYALTKGAIKRGMTPEYAKAINESLIKNKTIGKVMGSLAHSQMKHPGKWLAGGLALSAIPIAGGLMQKAKSKEEMDKQNKQTISNLALGPYNLGKRIKASLANKKKN